MSDRNPPPDDGSTPPRGRARLPSEWPYDADAIAGFPMPCLVVARDGRVQLANDEAAGLLAEAAATLRGRNLFGLLPSLQAALESDAHSSARLELRGQPFDVHVKRRADLDGESNGWVVALVEQPSAARALRSAVSGARSTAAKVTNTVTEPAGRSRPSLRASVRSRSISPAGAPPRTSRTRSPSASTPCARRSSRSTCGSAFAHSSSSPRT
jgi:hypothetical protein